MLTLIDNNPATTFGQRIRLSRLKKGLSQQALAEAISRFADQKKVARTTVTQWETNATKEIEAANLLKVAKILEVNPEWLRFGENI